MSGKREILHNAFVIKKAYDSMWDDISAKYNLTRAEIDVIAFLANNPELDTASCIVDYRMIAKSHVSKAVEQLIRRGFLIGSKDEKDRRQIHLKLTENINEAVEDIRKRQLEFVESLNKGIDEEESRIFDKIFQKITENASSLMQE